MKFLRLDVSFTNEERKRYDELALRKMSKSQRYELADEADYMNELYGAEAEQVDDNDDAGVHGEQEKADRGNASKVKTKSARQLYHRVLAVCTSLRLAGIKHIPTDVVWKFGPLPLMVQAMYGNNIKFNHDGDVLDEARDGSLVLRAVLTEAYQIMLWDTRTKIRSSSPHRSLPDHDVRYSQQDCSACRPAKHNRALDLLSHLEA